MDQGRLQLVIHACNFILGDKPFIPLQLTITLLRPLTSTTATMGQPESRPHPTPTGQHRSTLNVPPATARGTIWSSAAHRRVQIPRSASPNGTDAATVVPVEMIAAPYLPAPDLPRPVVEPFHNARRVGEQRRPRSVVARTDASAALSLAACRAAACGYPPRCFRTRALRHHGHGSGCTSVPRYKSRQYRPTPPMQDYGGQ